MYAFLESEVLGNTRVPSVEVYKGGGADRTRWHSQEGGLRQRRLV